MNIVLWIIQSILATMFCFSGIMILTQPKEKLAAKMPFVNDYSDPMVKLVAFAHIFGAIGLILPLLLNIMPILTPIAASGLILVMLLAIGYNKKRGDKKGVIVDLVMLSLFLFIAVCRFKGL
jgi:uncharacterized membrane protein YphA (DoxX/SURF4 family)